jgi:hypothetical protein
MELKLTNQEVWFSTLLFFGLDLVALLPLLFVARRGVLENMTRSIGIASAIFWGVLASFAIFGFWEIYYQYLYPTWVRWLTPLDVFLYGAVGLGMWWLASRLQNSPLMWFVPFGGVEGILEHLLGVYGFQILEKVPWLQGVTTLPVVVFSFFEYIFYWTLVAWLGYALFKIGGIFVS